MKAIQTCWILILYFFVVFVAHNLVLFLGNPLCTKIAQAFVSLRVYSGAFQWFRAPVFIV